MVKEKLLHFASIIQRLSKKEFERYLAIVLVAAAGILGGMIFFVYSRSKLLVNEIKKLEKLAGKTAGVLDQFNKMSIEENRTKELIEKNKDFNLKIFFEQFCKDNNITPEPAWDTITESVNEQFEEISLPVIFKNQTTKKLTEILQKIDTTEIIYIKNLGIRKNENQKITVELTLATKRQKQ